MPFTDVSPNAAWKRTVYEPATTPAFHPCHPVWNIKGVGRWHIMLDLMHTGSLGVLLNVLGGVFWEMLHDGPYHGTQAQIMHLGRQPEDLQQALL